MRSCMRAYVCICVGYGVDWWTGDFDLVVRGSTYGLSTTKISSSFLRPSNRPLLTSSRLRVSPIPS